MTRKVLKLNRLGQLKNIWFFNSHYPYYKNAVLLIGLVLGVVLLIRYGVEVTYFAAIEQHFKSVQSSKAFAADYPTQKKQLVILNKKLKNRWLGYQNLMMKQSDLFKFEAGFTKQLSQLGLTLQNIDSSRIKTLQISQKKVEVFEYTLVLVGSYRRYLQFLDYLSKQAFFFKHIELAKQESGKIQMKNVFQLLVNNEK